MADASYGRYLDRSDGDQDTILAYLLFVVFIAHFGAVLFHTLVLRDHLFSRMAPYRVPA
jgi:cytochrome b561